MTRFKKIFIYLFWLKSGTNITDKNIVFEGLHGNSHTIDGRFIIVKISATVNDQALTADALNS